MKTQICFQNRNQTGSKWCWWYCVGDELLTDFQTARAHLFQTGGFFREAFWTLRNILAVDCCTKNANTLLLFIHDIYGCFSKIWRTKYVISLCMGPTTHGKNLWRKLNSGCNLVANDVVACAAILGLFAGSAYTPFSWLFSVRRWR